MPKVVGIKFKSTAKTYYFDPGDRVFELNKGVIVETARGVEYGKVVMLPTEVSEDKIVSPLKPVIRIANEDDEKLYKKLEDKRDDAIKIATEKIEKSGLNMKLVDVEYTFDQSKLIIYFTADGRVDFRELVKELASAFHIRIELRQIGIRDQAKAVGGLGICGKECCCRQFLNDFDKVSIKMAKVQGLSLNTQKISGVCGRLMCCLSYENEYYSEVNAKMPKINSKVITKDGEGTVVYNNLLKQLVSVKFVNDDSVKINEYPLSEIKKKDVKE